MLFYQENRFLPYSSQQMFDLILDIEKYPEFLPWCTNLRITQKEKNFYIANMIVHFKGFQTSFVSHIQYNSQDHSIDVHYVHGPFKHLKNLWKFNETSQGCQVYFYIEFEFKSKLLQFTIGHFFTEMNKKMILAFEKRAHQMYSEPQN